jgi:hypothetical protein
MTRTDSKHGGERIGQRDLLLSRSFYMYTQADDPNGKHHITALALGLCRTGVLAGVSLAICESGDGATTV